MSTPFQAAIVRYVHDVVTQEFVNIGVILVCPSKSFAGAQFASSWSRVTRMFPGADLAAIEHFVQEVQRACKHLCAQEASSPQTDIAFLLSEIEVPDDIDVQFSGIRGATNDTGQTLSDLTSRYVEHYIVEKGFMT